MFWPISFLKDIFMQKKHIRAMLSYETSMISLFEAPKTPVFLFRNTSFWYTFFVLFVHREILRFPIHILSEKCFAVPKLWIFWSEQCLHIDAFDDAKCWGWLLRRPASTVGPTLTYAVRG